MVSTRTPARSSEPIHGSHRALRQAPELTNAYPRQALFPTRRPQPLRQHRRPSFGVPPTAVNPPTPANDPRQTGAATSTPSPVSSLPAPLSQGSSFPQRIPTQSAPAPLTAGRFVTSQPTLQRFPLMIAQHNQYCWPTCTHTRLQKVGYEHVNASDHRKFPIHQILQLFLWQDTRSQGNRC